MTESSPRVPRESVEPHIMEQFPSLGSGARPRSARRSRIEYDSSDGGISVFLLPLSAPRRR